MKRRCEAAAEAAKKPRLEAVAEEEEAPPPPPPPPEAAAAAELGEDLVLEVLKRADERTLGRAACVSRRWREMAEDERIWEAVCKRVGASMGCSPHQLRLVVLALGGFRRLYSMYMLPLRGTAAPRPPLPFPMPSRRAGRWGKEEVQLSLSLLSIGFFEKLSKGVRPGSGAGRRG